MGVTINDRPSREHSDDPDELAPKQDVHPCITRKLDVVSSTHPIRTIFKIKLALLLRLILVFIKMGK